MELAEAMRTQHACRFYSKQDIPDQVFYDAIENARFGPQGGNRQPVRFVIVRDPVKKKTLADLYIVPWTAYSQAAKEGIRAMTAEADGTEKATWIGINNPMKALENADHFAEHFAEHPVIVVVCADIANTHPTDTELGRLSIVGGASVYPIAQNLCLALRAQGVATTFTTLLCAYEEHVKELLGLPEQWSTACHIVAGYPAKPFPKTLHRAPVEELAFVDTWGDPLRATRSGS
jgi:nitroreductase